MGTAVPYTLHMNATPTTEKPKLVSSYRASKTYVYKNWHITVERWTKRQYACGTCRTTTGNYFTAFNKGSNARLSESGGITRAQQIIDRIK